MGKDNYPDADGDFNKAPYFNFNDGQVKFDTNDVDNPNGNYGSASGFVSKSLFVKCHAALLMCDIFLTGRADPAAKLATHLFNYFLKRNIFFHV